jgi:hypothetical protein
MENPWFGKKADGYVGLPLTWQGWLALIVGIGGGEACYRLLPHPINDWAAGGCALAFIISYWFKYDPDTESY